MGKITLDAVLSCPTLPTLPAVASQVLELTRDDDVRLDAIAACVQNDQALAGKILRTINSSYYGLKTPCPTISRAIGLLGLNTVKSLVLSFSLVDTIGTGDDDAFDYQAYWRRAVYAAAGARLLAERFSRRDPEEIFIAALLQDVGMVAILALQKKKYVQLVRRAGDDHDDLADIERDHYGFDHAEVSAAMAHKWRLPDELVTSIRWHHQPERPPDDQHEMVRLVALGCCAASVLSMDDPTPPLRTFRAQARAWFNVSGHDADALIDEISDRSRQLSRLFRLDTGEAADVATILSQASERMLEHQIRIQAETTQLRESNKALRKQSASDALTGAWNRGTFNEMLEDAFQDASTSGSPLSIAFIDADRFKVVNDTHGHQVGDIVLIELTHRFNEIVGERGHVCRYGGEEFAIILPGTDRAAAAQIAEAIRARVQETPFDVTDANPELGLLDVTVSIGVATLDAGSRSLFRTPEKLVLAADKGVYVAKSSGRNCVRVFAPRRSSTPTVAPDPAASSFAGTPTTSVLFIDNDPLCRAAVAQVNNNVDARMTVETYATTQQASMALETSARTPDVIVLDPGDDMMHAQDFVAQLRTRPRIGHCPVVILQPASEIELDDGVGATASDDQFAPPVTFLSKAQLAADVFGELSRLGAWSRSNNLAA